LSPPLRFTLALSLSLALLAALFVYLRISPAEVLEEVRGASLPTLAGVIGIHLGALAAKVLRWRVLLSASELLPDHAATTAQKHLVKDAVFSGWLGNLVLPAKTGELVRPLLYARRTGEPFSRVVATVVIERAIDLVVLSLGFWAVLSLVQTSVPLPQGVNLAAKAAGFGGLAIMGALFLLWRLHPVSANVLSKDEPESDPPRLWQRVVSSLAAFRLGLDSFRHPRALAAVFWWTTVSWALEVVGAVLCISAFDLRLEATWGAATAHVVATTLAVSAVPLPGGVGVEQPVTVAVFQPFATGVVMNETVLAVSLMLTLASIAWVVPLGLWGLIRQGARLGAGGLRDEIEA